MLLNKAIEQICQAFIVPAFANHGNHCIFFWQNNGELTILAIRTEGIECTSPEQISIAFSALGSGTGGNPGRGKQLFSIPSAAIQEEETEAVQFSQRERQAAPKVLPRGSHSQVGRLMPSGVKRRGVRYCARLQPARL